MRAFAPTIMASAVFGIGAILCFYVVCPSAPTARADQGMDSPSASSSFASMATGVAGVMLLFLTRGIQHRQRAPPSGWPSPCCASGLSAPCCIPELVRCPDVRSSSAFFFLFFFLVLPHTEEVLPPVLLVEAAAPHPPLACVRHRSSVLVCPPGARPADLPHGPFQIPSLWRLSPTTPPTPHRPVFPHVRCR